MSIVPIYFKIHAIRKIPIDLWCNCLNFVTRKLTKHPSESVINASTFPLKKTHAHKRTCAKSSKKSTRSSLDSQRSDFQSALTKRWGGQRRRRAVATTSLPPCFVCRCAHVPVWTARIQIYAGARRSACACTYCTYGREHTRRRSMKGVSGGGRRPHHLTSV